MNLFELFKKKEDVPVTPIEDLPKTILVVDDDEFFRKAYQDILTRNNYIVITATNGQEALTILEERAFDVILLDITMPVMDGLKLLKTLRENEKTKDIQVVMLSSAGNIKNMEEAAYYSAHRFLNKSTAKPEEVVNAVQEAVRASQSQKQQTAQPS